MKKREKVQEVNQKIKFRNISGVSGQYKNNAKGNFMNKILQGCAEVDRKEQIERGKQQDYQRNKEFLSEMVRDIRELGKEYEKQGNDENSVIDDVIA